MRGFAARLVFICLLLLNGCVYAQSPVTLTMTNVNLADAVRLLAGYLHLNVIISRSVQGTATFNLNQAAPQTVFDLLLISHGLSKWKVGNVWLIARQDELMKRRQALAKWQEVDEASAPLLVEGWQIRYAQADQVAKLMVDGRKSILSARGSVRSDERTNQVFVQDTQERLLRVGQLIRRVDIPSQQVVVDARIVSVNSDAEKALGFEFAVQPSGAESGMQGDSSQKSAGRYSLAVARLADGSLLDVKLAALENAGQAELISSPSLFAANQQTASIEAGEEVPYQEVSESGGTAVAFKKAVLGLRVTPQILPGNKILLKLQINQDRPDNHMVQNMPTISTRQITTSILSSSGQTIVLGGIYENSAEMGENQLPFLSNIPLLGWLFKLRMNHVGKRELLIFVTPTIVDHAI